MLLQVPQETHQYGGSRPTSAQTNRSSTSFQPRNTVKIEQFVKENWANTRKNFPSGRLRRMLKRGVPELADLSELMLGYMLNQAELITLDANKQHYYIPEPLRLGFYYLLRGDASLFFRADQVTDATEDCPADIESVEYPVELETF
jgi:hypothetical protein